MAKCIEPDKILIGAKYPKKFFLNPEIRQPYVAFSAKFEPVILDQMSA